MDRTGIAPVLAILLLAVLGVGALVTVGAFLFDLQIGLRDIVTPERTSLEAIEVMCSGSTVNLTVVNTGQEDLSGDNATALLFETDTLLATEEVAVAEKNFTDVGGIDDLSVNFSDCFPGCMDAGTFYRAEVDFPIGYTLRSTCYAE